MDLRELKQRVDQATGSIDAVTAAGWANDLSPWETGSHEWMLFIRALGGSIDAALELVERKLPGWTIVMYTHGEPGEKDQRPCAVVHSLTKNRKFINLSHDGRAAILPLAILSALLGALIAEQER